MKLKTLIDETANRADEILDGCTNPSEARIILLELLAAEQPSVAPPDREKIANEVTAMLKEEGFFDASQSGNSWSEGSDDDSDED